MKRTLSVVALLVATLSVSVSAQQKPVSQQQQQAGADAIGRFFYPPEFVMQNAAAISLTDAQRNALSTAVQQVQAKMVDAQFKMSSEGDKLTKLVQGSTVDEPQMLAEVDRLLAIERDVRRAQVSLMVKVKNTLTPAQQAKLNQLRGDKQ
jgi:Spy/CpxP family protein refolding chaperone